jgi:1-acyl-sn-glycerol-3-phosphate acyltransferase
MQHARSTPMLVQAWRCLHVLLRLLIIGFKAAIVYPLVGSVGRARLKRLGSRQLLRALGIRLETGDSDAPSGSLIVANHVSWLDIFVINSLRPAAFVSKSEVRGWPFVGWLAARNDTVFLQRGTRNHARDINAKIDGLLDAGIDVAVFPEGTTSDGTELRSFHAALLQPAIETGHAVLPLAISYLDCEGKVSTAPAFAGQTTLPQCFRAILASRELTVRLTPCPAIAPEGRTRREISQLAHAAIADALATSDGFQRPRTAPERSPDLQAELS